MVDFPALRAAAKPLREAVAAAEADLISFGAETARLEREGEPTTQRARSGMTSARRSSAPGPLPGSPCTSCLAGELDAADPTELPAALDPEVPLILLPVRLETRLKPDGPDPTTLLVRIFPDDVHVESHEPGAHRRRASAGTALLDDGLACGQEREQPRRPGQDPDGCVGGAAQCSRPGASALGGAAAHTSRRQPSRRAGRGCTGADAPGGPRSAVTAGLGPPPRRRSRTGSWSTPFERDDSGNEILVGEHTGSTVLDSMQVGPGS